MYEVIDGNEIKLEFALVNYTNKSELHILGYKDDGTLQRDMDTIWYWDNYHYRFAMYRDCTIHIIDSIFGKELQFSGTVQEYSVNHLKDNYNLTYDDVKYYISDYYSVKRVNRLFREPKNMYSLNTGICLKCVDYNDIFIKSFINVPYKIEIPIVRFKKI